MKEIEKILADFYFHITGVRDYGCKHCKKAHTEILSLIKSIVPEEATRNSFEMIDWSDDDINSWNACRDEMLKRLEVE